MSFLAIIERFIPLLDELKPKRGDGEQRIDPSVVAELEDALAVLDATVGRVQAIRNTRVNTSEMSIEEIDALIRGGMQG